MACPLRNSPWNGAKEFSNCFLKEPEKITLSDQFIPYLSQIGMETSCCLIQNYRVMKPCEASCGQCRSKRILFVLFRLYLMQEPEVKAGVRLHGISWPTNCCLKDMNTFNWKFEPQTMVGFRSIENEAWK